MNLIANPTSLLRPPLRLLVGVILLLGGGALRAEEPIIVGTPRHATDVATIRTLEDESRLALLHHDFPTLERIWSERFIVNAPNNVVIAGRAAVLDRFRSRGARSYSSYEKTIEYLVFEGDFAIVLGSDAVVPVTASAPPAVVRRRYTNIWTREQGRWRLFARHANVETAGMPGAPVAPRPAS